MEILVALLPLVLWLVLFIILIKKFKFNKKVFIICLGLTVLLNLNGILSLQYLASVLVSIIGQILFLYVIIDFIYNIVKRRKASEENHL